MQNTQAINVSAGNATATGSVTVSDNMPAVPCPDPAGYKYVGARYVPLFADPAEWNINSTYEPLTIVLNEGNSYTSKQYVPVGINIDNEDYWAKTGNYNAQIELYRKEVSSLKDEVVRFNNAVVYATVEAMKADNAIEVGELVATKGFYSVGDGGEAMYLIAAEGTPNDMDIISLDNGLIATMVYGSELNTAQFGINESLNDAGPHIRRMLDVADSKKYIVFNSIATVRTSITLNNNEYFYMRSVIGNDFCIKAYNHLFIGSELANNLTNVYAHMERIRVDFLTPSFYTVFKGIIITSSQIDNCEFYHFAYFLEGGTQYASRITNCRFQSYSHAVFSSVTFADGDANARNMNYVQEYYTANNSLNGCSAVYTYTGKLSDNQWIDNCYFSGLSAQSTITNKACLIFTINDIDRDTMINNCWIEFIYYMLRPLSTDSTAYGIRFINNTVQFCVNLLQPSSNYTSWIISGNRLAGFNSDLYKVIGTVTDDFAVIKSEGVLSRIFLTDNMCSDVDKMIIFNGNNSNTFYVKESNTINGEHSQSPASDLFDITYFSTTPDSSTPITPFTYSTIESLGSITTTSESLPNLDENKPRIHNIFHNTRFYTPNGVNMVVQSSNYGQYKYATINANA